MDPASPPLAPPIPESALQAPARKTRGFLNPGKVRSFAFWVISMCILVSVAACIMAIWDSSKSDVLWRTIATCVVVAGGCGIFAGVNVSFGSPRE